MNVFFEDRFVTREDREKLLKQKGCLIWFTGMSGSGKSTLAKRIEKDLNSRGKLTYFLDGDNLRLSLNRDLGFSEEDRKENIRRAKEVSKILIDSGIIVLAAFISPKEDVRKEIRNEFKSEFHEIYISCSIDECKNRDVKGLYKKACSGEIKDFTGITNNYEIPKNPNLTIDTMNLNVFESVKLINLYLKEVGII